MKTLDDIQLAISSLVGAEQSRFIAWAKERTRFSGWVVREAAAPIYGGTSRMRAIQTAIERLDPEHIDELRDWLQRIDGETPRMLAAIDEGLRSLEEKGGIEFTREELLARVRQWAGMSS
jgi:hypothetical protein